jgi:hypothetical protein
MLTFLTFWKHAATDCPIHNEKWRGPMAELDSKQDEIAAKHGVKIVGWWNVHSEHLVVEVFEAPSFEAFQAYLMEPEELNMLNFNTMEIKTAMTYEETMEFMQRMMLHFFFFHLQHFFKNFLRAAYSTVTVFFQLLLVKIVIISMLELDISPILRVYTS